MSEIAKIIEASQSKMEDTSDGAYLMAVDSDTVMDIVKNQAIAFAKFAMLNTLQCGNLLWNGNEAGGRIDSWSYESHYGVYEDKSSEELYELFINQQQ